MRQTCIKCGKWVKDKFLFGFLHFCIDDIKDKEYITKFFSCQCNDAPRGHVHTDLDGEFMMPKNIMYRTRSEWEEHNFNQS